MNGLNQSKRCVIIDTDCGSDDALAILLASFCHKNELINLLAITCSYGNTSVDNVVKNVFHTLQVSEIEKIKVYKGCSNPIVNKKGFQDGFFGDDGLGDSTEEMSAVDIVIESEHAVNALSRLAKEFPKKITVIALGPLTNLALTHLIDPQFFNNIEQIFIMGGSISAFGNSGPNTEFNFFNDPEAVHVVLTNSECPLTVIPWETCLKHLIPWDIYHELIELNTEKADFFDKIYRRIVLCDNDNGENGRPGLISCDILVVIAVVFPEFICETSEYPALIELNGLLTRGQLVIDRRQETNINNALNGRAVKFINLLNQSKFMDLLFEIIE